MMKSNYLKIALAAALALCLGAVTGCKDDDDDTATYYYFMGTLSFDIPTFVLPGSTHHLSPGGAYLEEGNTLGLDPDTDYGIYWKVTTDDTKLQQDTVRFAGDPVSVTGDIDFVVPDALCTITLTCYYYASGYINASCAKTVYIVDPEKSLTGFTYPETTFVDSRDSKEYHYSTIGGVDWMSENLEYYTDEGFGMPYEDSEIGAYIMGSFYTYEEAQEACPDGWTLPSESDWDALATALAAEIKEGDPVYYGIAGSMMADVALNGDTLWEFWPDVKKTNSSGFSAFPAGYATVSGEDSSGNVTYTFTGFKEYASFWTSTDTYYRYIYVEDNDVYKTKGTEKNIALPVRCIRTSE